MDGFMLDKNPGSRVRQYSVINIRLVYILRNVSVIIKTLY